MITPNGPPSGGWVMSTTVSRNRGSRISRLAMRNIPFAISAAVAGAPHGSAAARTRTTLNKSFIAAEIGTGSQRMPETAATDQTPAPEKSLETRDWRLETGTHLKNAGSHRFLRPLSV